MNSNSFSCPFDAHSHNALCPHSWVLALCLVNTMSSRFAPFCNKISIAIHDFVLSAYLRGVHSSTQSCLLTSTPENDRSCWMYGLLYEAATCKAVLPPLS